MEETSTYTLSSYEALCDMFSVSWILKIDHCFSIDEYTLALRKTLHEHPYLRCTVNKPSESNPFFIELIDEYDDCPNVSFIENIHEDTAAKEYFMQFSKVYSNKKHVKTCEYCVLIDKLHNSSYLLGVFDHSCCDALSSLQVAHTILKYLSNPSENPQERQWKSVQNEVIVPNDWHTDYYESFKNTFFKPPSFIHPIDNTLSRFNSQTCHISISDLDIILAACKLYNCTFQGLLWISAAINYMKLFYITFPKSFRFQTPATTLNRVQFRTPIVPEDLVCGAAAIYVNQEITQDSLFWETASMLSKQLHDELLSNTQMYDFFKILNTNNFGCLPQYSITACTLGVSCLQSTYEGEHTINLKNIAFLGLTKLFPGVSGLNIHAFTIKDLGCYLCCSYVYPGFSDQEALSYVNGIVSTMKTACKNYQIKIQDL